MHRTNENKKKEKSFSLFIPHKNKFIFEFSVYNNVQRASTYLELLKSKPYMLA